MSKLTAAIRIHWVVVPHIEAKAPSSRSARQTVAPSMQGLGFAWRTPSVAIPIPSMVLRTRLHPVEIEGMNASVRELFVSERKIVHWQ
jgi:hypothetical protein